MNTLNTVIKELYLSIHSEWMRMKYEPSGFPEAATIALKRCKLHENFNLNSLLEHMVSKDHQAHRLGTHPAAAIPLIRSSYFNVYIHFWIDEVADLHSHQWGGAFTILDGEAIHSRYGFEESRFFHSDLRIGSMKYLGIERLLRGDVVKVEPGLNFVHGVAHIPRPSVSLSVRNSNGLSDLKSFYRHIGNAAFSANSKDALLDNQLKVLLPLSISHEQLFLERVNNMLQSTDTLSGYKMLLKVQSLNLEYSNLKALCKQWSGDSQDRLALIKSLPLSQRENLVSDLFSDIYDYGLRRFLAVIMFSPDHKSIVESVKELWNTTNSSEIITELIAELNNNIGGDKDSLFTTIFYVALESGGDAQVIMRNLKNKQMVSKSEESILSMVNQILENPFLSPFFRNQ